MKDMETLTILDSIWFINGAMMTTIMIFQTCGSSRSDAGYSVVTARVATVKLSEMAGRENRDQKAAHSNRGNARDGMNIEFAHLKNEEVANDDIEPSPKHIHGRRRKSLARRLGEGSLKSPPHKAAYEVRDGVC